LLAIGYIQQIFDEVLVIGEKKHSLHTIKVNTNVKISIFSSKQGFRVLLGTVYTSSPSLMKIADVRAIVDKERRNYFRVDMQVPVDIYLDIMDTIDESNRKEGTIMDMSLNGFMLQIKEEIGARRDVWAEFELRGKKCSIQCRISREIQCDIKGTYRYGCEFMSTERGKDSQRDLICSYLFQVQRDILNRRRMAEPE
jgi:hypothetical protein